MPQPSSINPNFPQQKSAVQGQFQHLALGGTFDRLHRGHKEFLRYALSLSSRLAIGLTTDSFSRILHPGERLLPYAQRKKDILQYLLTIKAGEKIAIVKLIDLYGPTLIKDNVFDCLLVTDNTRKGAKEINRKRQSLGLPQLKVRIYSLLSATDGLPISSSRIRNGEINRQGTSHYKCLITKAPLFLPWEHRHIFQKPFGKVFSGNSLHLHNVMQRVVKYVQKNNLQPVICVGDIVTSLFVELTGWPQLSLVDFHVQRRRQYRQVSELGDISGLTLHRLANPAGSLTVRLIKSVNQALLKKEPSLIQIRGEEDLAVLPSVLLAPLGSVVIYGHFQLGVILVEVTEPKKRQALKLLNLLTKGNKS